MARAAQRAELRRLEESVAEIQKTVLDLEARRDELTVRAAVLSLLERVTAEADEHLARFGAPPLLRGPDLAADGGGPRACAALGLPAPTALEERIDLLRPGRSLLCLEGCAAGRLCGRLCPHARATACASVGADARLRVCLGAARTKAPVPLAIPDQGDGRRGGGRAVADSGSGAPLRRADRGPRPRCGGGLRCGIAG
jgi:hypothetical protein